MFDRELPASLFALFMNANMDFQGMYCHHYQLKGKPT